MGADRGFWSRQVVEDAFLKMNPTVMWDELGGSAGRGTAPVHELVGTVKRKLVPESSRLARTKEKQEVGLQKSVEGRFRVWCTNMPKTMPKTEHTERKDTDREG